MRLAERGFMMGKSTPLWTTSIDRFDRLCRSKKAQMPFSIVAVLILVLSSASIVLICGMNLRNETGSYSNESIGVLKSTSSKCSLEFEQAAYVLAIDAIRDASPVNESALCGQFRMLLNSYIAQDYPRYVSGSKIDLNNTNITLIFLRMTMNELYPELASPDTSDSLRWNGETIPAYFALSGSYEIVVKGSRGSLIKRYDLNKELHIPVPLLSNRLQAFSSALSGGRSEFENIVRYELSALAQDRVLRGYGSGSRDGENGTGQILTNQDVTNAINLALLLEQRRYLRNVDEGSLRSLARSLSDGGLLRAPGVISDVRMGGVLDPADLFLRLYDSDGYDMRTIFAESLYAISDVLVLRWLDYFHIVNVLEFLERAKECVDIGFSAIIEHIFDVDTMQDSMVSWMSSRLMQSGYPESAYRYIHYNSPDAIVEVPVHRMVFFDESNESHPVVFNGVQGVDFSSVDLYASDAWKIFYVQYKSQTFELGQVFDDFVKSLAIGIASNSNLPDIQLRLDPRDREDFIDDLERQVKGAIVDNENWMAPAVEQARKSIVLVDQMGESLSRFITQYWQEILGRNESIDYAFRTLARNLVQDNLNAMPSMSSKAVESAVNRVYWELKLSRTWGLRENVENAYDTQVMGTVGLLKSVFNGLESSFPLKNEVVGLINGVVGGMPSIENTLSSLVLRLVSDIGDCLQFRADRVTIPVSIQEEFNFFSDRRTKIQEKLDLNCSSFLATDPNGLDTTTSKDRLSVNIEKPWDYDSKSEYYPNRHLTDVGNLSMTPYTTQWQIDFEGSVNTTLESKSIGYSVLGKGDTLKASSLVSFIGDFTIVVSSCWPLVGVQYESSTTLLAEVVKFLEVIWSKIAGGVGFIAEGLSKTFSCFQTITSSLLAFSARAVEFISCLLQTMVEEVRGYFGGVLSDLLGWVAEAVSTALGTISFRISMFGLKFCIETNALDLSLTGAKDMLKISFSASAMGAVISVSSRFVGLGFGDYDLLTNATLSTDRWKLDIVVDPLMKLFKHFVEINGVLDKHVFEMYLPEIVNYDQFRLSVHQIPGIGNILSNIPIPIPGASGSIDVGLVVKYSSPFMNTPMINEFEQNPPGDDFDREWIEIFNPTDKPCSLTGWTIETVHGIQRVDSLGKSWIAPYSHGVYVLNGQVLDNGGESKFPLAECAILRNANGDRVDSTPWTTDYYNDGRTWQRTYDGSDRWVFKAETCGIANSKKTVVPTEAIQLRETLLKSISDAVYDVTRSITSLAELGAFARRVIEHVLGNCLDLLSNAIIEIRFYVEVSIQDISSTAGAGFTLSLVATGDSLESALRWIGQTIAGAIENLMNPYSSASQSHSVKELAEDVYVRASAFGRVGLPKMVSSMTESPDLRFDALVEINLALLGGMFGANLGKEEINFGVCISEMPGEFLSPVFGIDSDKLADLWIFKAHIYET